MLFNSLTYAIFLPIVFVIYWVLRKNFKWQNIALLLASYLFYAYWDWRFLGLLIGMSLIAFVCGKAIVKSEERQKCRRRTQGAKRNIRKQILAGCQYCG